VINRFIDLSIAHKYTVLVLLAALCVVGWWSMRTIPVDALPDLSDTQVILYSKWDRSPDVIEDQVTYPIVTALTGAPKVKTVRGISDFGYSLIYVIFEDGTDLYWARTRTMEYLSSVQGQLPEGVKTQLGPDATGLDWVYQYALVDTSGKQSLSDLRAYQDWTLGLALKSVPGVAEVPSLGGFQRQFQVNVDPTRLLAYGLSIHQVVQAVQDGNVEAGGRLLEFGGTEYMVRGRGYARSIADFENIVLKSAGGGVPIRVKDVGQVTMGPEMRRGVAELNGTGEAVSGIIVMRQGENALAVIARVKARLHQLESTLPPGVKLVPVYDRSDLIHAAVSSVRWTMIEVLLTVAVIVLIFLWHFPSAVIPVITIPIALLLSFIPLRLLGFSANIMSLAGMAIAFSELIDASIIVAEQTHKKLEGWERTGRVEDRTGVIVGAIKQVAGPSFFALIIIAISFLPVFALESQEGRMFKPFALSKTLAMVVAACLTLTLDPALRILLMRIKRAEFRPTWLAKVYNSVLIGTIRSEEKHPISRWLIRAYQPIVGAALRFKWIVIGIALALMVVSIPVYQSLGSEFMPRLDEGSILYMPTTMPGISIGEAQRLLTTTDSLILQFPEVERVLGKSGRADTSTDPAPLSMFETVIVLKPKSEWRHVPTWYSSWAPNWAVVVFRHFTPNTISSEELIRRLDATLRVPGLINAWTMPIKGRIDMLSTGIRTPLGLKITGPNATTIEQTGTQVETILATMRGTRSVFTERTSTGHYIDIRWKRERLALYGLSVEDAQEVVRNAIGGENVTTAIVGRERYPVNVRLMRDYRSDLGSLKRLVLSAGGDRRVALGDLADISIEQAPSMIRDENGLLTGYVYVDLDGRDPQSYVKEGQQLLAQKLAVPSNVSVTWSGQYESMLRVHQRLTYIIPVTILLIAFVLYLSTRSVIKTMIVMLAVPFSAIGAVWYLYLAGYHLSIAVLVGIVALMGVDAETGVFMLLYLDIAYEEARVADRLRNPAELRAAILAGAAKRVRPKFMTFATTCLGLLPIMLATGIGSDLMKRIAAPMVGGIFTSFLLELLVYPVIYEIWRTRTLHFDRDRSLEEEIRYVNSAT
jgi:Cu(I)/Ag(I) efflux system membrane protein CusA/SilA